VSFSSDGDLAVVLADSQHGTANPSLHLYPRKRMVSKPRKMRLHAARCWVWSKTMRVFTKARHLQPHCANAPSRQEVVAAFLCFLAFLASPSDPLLDPLFAPLDIPFFIHLFINNPIRPTDWIGCGAYYSDCEEHIPRHRIQLLSTTRSSIELKQGEINNVETRPNAEKTKNNNKIQTFLSLAGIKGSKLST
jgi:hypothetical protein